MNHRLRKRKRTPEETASNGNLFFFVPYATISHAYCCHFTLNVIPLHFHCVIKSSIMKKPFGILLALCLLSCCAFAQTIVHIDNPDTWTSRSMTDYVGQTVKFDVPFYICNNYNYNSGVYTIAPRRIYAPTNQAIPSTLEYTNIVTANSNAAVTLNGLYDYHRMGEKLTDFSVRINSATNWTLVADPTFVGNSRTELNNGFPSVDIRGTHTLLVCAFNLEYYLVESIGQGYGPETAEESQRQHTKIMDALTHINADIFGFVEIEQGQTALAKLANALSAATGHNYSYIDDGTGASGTYTKSGYIYRTDKVTPYGNLYDNNIGVNNRKKLIAFTENANQERFIFSINHFKAKSGSASGEDADKGDGQGSYNAARVREAQSVLASYNDKKNYYNDPDILIMGDLNAYAKEDPVRTLTNGGMIDLHRYFHADSSYSYVFHQQAGYLDHALVNSTMLAQVTGMQAYHINSDENDAFTYDKSSDLSMFRSSDHDPVLVGLALGQNYSTDSDNSFELCTVKMYANQLHISNALGGYYRLYNGMGLLISQGNINQTDYTLSLDNYKGFYIINVFVENQVKQVKLFIH